MKKIVYVFTLCLFLGGMVAPACAQRGDKPMQKIQQFKKMKLLETLDLDEETANKFLVKYDKWEKQISDINQQRMILVQELRLAMEKKAGDDEINHTLDSLVDYTTKADDARHQMFSDMRSILSAKQAAKLALFEAQFQRKLQETLNKLQQHRGMGHGDGGMDEHMR
jgi:hypothetical protein